MKVSCAHCQQPIAAASSWLCPGCWGRVTFELRHARTTYEGRLRASRSEKPRQYDPEVETASLAKAEQAILTHLAA